MRHNAQPFTNMWQHRRTHSLFYFSLLESPPKRPRSPSKAVAYMDPSAFTMDFPRPNVVLDTLTQLFPYESSLKRQDVVTGLGIGGIGGFCAGSNNSSSSSSFALITSRGIIIIIIMIVVTVTPNSSLSRNIWQHD